MRLRHCAPLLALTTCFLASAAAQGSQSQDAGADGARAEEQLPGPEWEPTSSKAPPSPVYETVPDAPVAEPDPTPAAAPEEAPTMRAAGAEAVAFKDTKTRPSKIAHKGFVLQAQVGALGCSRRICNDNHGGTPGASFGGFVGGNIAGFVEIGLRGSYAKLGDSVGEGQNALALHGLDGAKLSALITERTGAPIDLPMEDFNVSSASLMTASAGLGLRVHMIPRGRMGAYVGSGIGYQLYRSRYQTARGPGTLDFHALQIPVEVGSEVYVAPHVALGARFEYRIPHYLVASIDHPGQSAAAPFSLVQEAGEMMGTDLRGDMPHFWSAGATVRTNF